MSLLKAKQKAAPGQTPGHFSIIELESAEREIIHRAYSDTRIIISGREG